MSATSQSITSSELSLVTRRRAAVRRVQPTIAAMGIADSDLAPATAAAAVPQSSSLDILATGDEATQELCHPSGRTETRNAVPVVKRPSPNSNGAVPLSSRVATKKKVSKRVKPRWLTVVRLFTKNSLFLLILMGLIEMVQRLVMDSNTLNIDRLAVIWGDFNGKFAEAEVFVKKTTKMMQVQVELIERKLENKIQPVKGEFSKKLEAKEAEFVSKLNELDERTVNLESSVSKMGAENWLSKEEFDKFLEEFKEKKSSENSGVSLDEIKLYARESVEREIAKHVADGLGWMDYALAAGGARVVKHSQPYIISKGWSGSWISLPTRNTVHKDANKILSPSFGEPGQCLPLRGSNGFVQVRLRAAIIPEAVTLEHVAKSVAYDRSSAPKDCRVFGWLQGEDTSGDETSHSDKRFLLTEFTYDLEKSNAQTYKVAQSAETVVVDTIRLDFASNHGRISHTCIYRLRVHGREPKSVSMLP
ncbi:hypothetical protein DM860_011567 [Cuscuta australis]|uniref:SUN domain-containing protein n=1 Tax=Cuscuta australis TaxID=267555 RepID=A0A328D3T5_9ASTE|nr:hypothetical protein DM860_011567 [Cuscuta australis]